MNNRWLMLSIGAVAVILLGFLISRGGKSSARVESHESGSPQELYSRAVALQKNNQIEKARETFQELMTNYPDYEDMEKVQKSLEALNLSMIYANADSPKTVLHEIKTGDTLGKIAKKYGTTVELIKKKNNLASDVIRVGQKLYVWTGACSIFVDKSQNILILKDGDQVVKVYEVATGSNNITPIGSYKITSKLIDPVWFKAGAVIPPESPQNVLGTRWLGFDLPGYGIHGTIEPDKMGQQVTAGCVRMRNEDVEQLYDIVPIGTPVTIVD